MTDPTNHEAPTEEQIEALHNALGGDGWAYTNYGGEELRSKRVELIAGVQAVLNLSQPPPVAETVEAMRRQGQDEGFAAAVSWLRDRSAQHPPASLWHAAQLLSDQMEASRRPAAHGANP